MNVKNKLVIIIAQKYLLVMLSSLRCVISNVHRELSGDFSFSRNCDVTIRQKTITGQS
jgi:hypothetical protein